MRREGVSLIVSDKGLFNRHAYKSEKELENLAMNYTQNIFGEDAIYFDIKRKMTSSKGISGIPDGFVLDFKNNKCYVVEVELSAHDIIRHISNQLVRFKVAMSNNIMRKQLSREFYDRLAEMHLRQDISLNNIQKIIDSQFGIVIIIDDISEQLVEVVNVLSQDGMEVIAIPFESYVDLKNNHLYRFTTFTKEALEKESKKWTFKWTDVPIEKHINQLDDGSKKIFGELREKICDISPDIKEVHRTNWTTFQISKLGNFCTFKFPKGKLEIYLKVNKYFKDNKKITEDIKRTPSWTFDKVFTIKSQNEIDYAIFLIEQAYQCICSLKTKTRRA